MAKKGEHKPRKNLLGVRFGKLVVVEYAGYKTTLNGVVQHQWYCKCDCGNHKIVESRQLLSGHSKSCGCLPHKPINPAHKHHLTDTPLYNIWKNMKGRCYTKSNTGYKHYGGRGITVCEEWKNDYMAFHNWAMANGYKLGLSIERNDVNGNYDPTNCRWATQIEQANNKTDTVYYDIEGEKLTLRAISEKYNVPYKTLKGRIDHGYSINDAIHGDFKNYKLTLTYKGETKTIPEWSKETGIKKVTLYRRYYDGWTTEEILTTPIDRKKRYPHS